MSFTCSKSALFCVFYSTVRVKNVGGGWVILGEKTFKIP